MTSSKTDGKIKYDLTGIWDIYLQNSKQLRLELKEELSQVNKFIYLKNIIIILENCFSQFLIQNFITLRVVP